MNKKLTCFEKAGCEKEVCLKLEEMYQKIYNPDGCITREMLLIVYRRGLTLQNDEWKLTSKKETVEKNYFEKMGLDKETAKELERVHANCINDGIPSDRFDVLTEYYKHRSNR